MNLLYQPIPFRGFGGKRSFGIGRSKMFISKQSVIPIPS